MPSSIRRIDVAGRDVTEYLQTLLRKSGYVFHTSAEKEVVRLIKESTSYIAHDPRKEEKEWAARSGDQSKAAEYVLPDGHKLKVSNAAAFLLCFCSNEMLFWSMKRNRASENLEAAHGHPERLRLSRDSMREHMS